jgi:hypothetical protein
MRYQPVARYKPNVPPQCNSVQLLHLAEVVEVVLAAATDNIIMESPAEMQGFFVSLFK